jgi:hypothetical protein
MSCCENRKKCWRLAKFLVMEGIHTSHIQERVLPRNFFHQKLAISQNAHCSTVKTYHSWRRAINIQIGGDLFFPIQGGGKYHTVCLENMYSGM